MAGDTGLIGEEIILANLSEIALQIPKVKEGSLSLQKFQAFIDEAVANGVSKERIRQTLEAHGVAIKEKSEQHGLTSAEITDLARAAAYARRQRQLGETIAFGDSEVEGTDTIDLRAGRKSIDPVIGKRFDAHGIAKGNYKEQLEALNYLLTKGIDPQRRFHTVPLRETNEVEAALAAGLGADGPYTDGGFIVIGSPDKLIMDNGIVAVLVNEDYYRAIDVLRQRFPGIKFIRADEMQTGLADLIAKKKRSRLKSFA